MMSSSRSKKEKRHKKSVDDVERKSCLSLLSDEELAREITHHQACNI